MAGPMRKLSQLPLDLGTRSAFGREDFLIGASNAAAVNLIDRWPEWHSPLMIISGPAASGKSHLAAVWRERAKAEIVRPEMLLSRPAEQIAAAAGRKGGQNVRPENRNFSRDRQAASEAGRKGGESSRRH